MKKTFLIILASITMFAFTQCNSTNNNGKNAKDKDDTEEEDEIDEDASREYKEFLEAAKVYEKALKKARSCEDLEDAEYVLEDTDFYRNTINERYDEDEQMTRAEERKFDERVEEIDDLLYELKEKFGCDDWDDDDWDDEDWDDDDWNWDEDYWGDTVTEVSYLAGAGSLQYKELKQGLEEVRKEMRDARDCDDLQSAVLSLLFYAFKDYDEKDMMTSSEEAEIERISEEITNLYDEKAKQFGGCDDDSDDSWDFDDDDADDWNWDD